MNNQIILNENPKGMAITKLNTYGEHVWSKATGLNTGGGSDDCIMGIIETNDEGFIVSGYITGRKTINGDEISVTRNEAGITIRYDVNGEIKNYKVIQGNSHDTARFIKKDSQGYIVCVSSTSSILNVDEIKIKNVGEYFISFMFFNWDI